MARAELRPLPSYPLVAQKAQIHGEVWARVVVSESGEVVCLSVTQVPFGISQGAENSVKQWKFAPYEIDGRPVRFTGEIVFHFDGLYPEQWDELQRTLFY